MPYFAVQWDYRGEKGYGHVIEGIDDAPERDNEGYELRGEAGDKGAGEFPRCAFSFYSNFAASRAILLIRSVM